MPKKGGEHMPADTDTQMIDSKKPILAHQTQSSRSKVFQDLLAAGDAIDHAKNIFM